MKGYITIDKHVSFNGNVNWKLIHFLRDGHILVVKLKLSEFQRTGIHNHNKWWEHLSSSYEQEKKITLLELFLIKSMKSPGEDRRKGQDK